MLRQQVGRTDPRISEWCRYPFRERDGSVAATIEWGPALVTHPRRVVPWLLNAVSDNTSWHLAHS